MFFDMHEQRRFLRLDVDFPARIIANSGQEDESVLEGRILDISDAGFRMALNTDTTLASGQHLEVILYIPDNGGQEPVEISATLVWLEHDSPEQGRMTIGAYLNDLLDLDLDELM